MKNDGPKKSNAPRGFPKEGECGASRTKLRPSRAEVEAREMVRRLPSIIAVDHLLSIGFRWT